MATKKKATANAPALKKPVRRKDGQPTRAEKSAINKAVRRAEVSSSRAIVETTLREVRQSGQDAVAAYVASAEVSKIIGHPVEWNDALGKALFALIATGHGMKEISEMPGMPPLFQMLQWLENDAHPFAVTRARAKELLVPLYEETAHRIGMSSNPLILHTKRQVLNRDGDVVDVFEEREVDNVERSKLAISTLQWTLSHLKPKKHGRNPEGSAGKNEQLEGLFAALKAGPVEPKG